jgi:superfamily II DNA helicase RecQ
MRLDFRRNYAKLGVLCAMYPGIPVLTMTATATRNDIQCILKSLRLKNCKCIVANPDRKNIIFQKIFCKGKMFDAIQSILIPIARGLLEKGLLYIH